MPSFPQLFFYAASVVAVVAVGWRARRWARLPLHVRWELYPVGHEPSGGATPGSSFMESSEWWRRPRRISRWAALQRTAHEIVLLAGVREHNRPLWRWSFPFHLGLYLSCLAGVLALATGALVAAGVGGGALAATGRHLMVGAGVPGLLLGVVGALGLLHRRLTRPEVRAYTLPADLFHLVAFVVALGTGLVTFALVDRDGVLAVTFAARLVTFDLAPLPGAGVARWLPIASVALLGALVAYVPLTHMSHFFVKYFAYHSIRWNDEPNLRGGRLEAPIRAVLSRPVTWAAPHVGAGAQRTWADVVDQLPGTAGR